MHTRDDMFPEGVCSEVDVVQCREPEKIFSP